MIFNSFSRKYPPKQGLHYLQKKTCLFNFYCCFESKLHWIFYINYKHIVSLFFSFVSQRFCTCIRSYLQTKTYFHTYSYTQPVVLIVVVVIVVSMLFSFSIQTKKWSKSECKRRSWKLGSFLLLHLVLYAPTTQRWLNWFHECPSFSPE